MAKSKSDWVSVGQTLPWGAIETGYKIGAVAGLTGLSTDTIRAWERRYDLIEPNRGVNNNRLYTQRHVKKLISIKLLVDAGQAIGRVSRLTEDELEQKSALMINRQELTSAAASSGWMVFSVQRPAWLLACLDAQPNLKINWCCDFAQLDVDRYEFVLIDMPSLSESNEQEINDRIPASLCERCLVVYRFASRKQLRSLAARGFKLLKGPFEPFALANLLGEPEEATSTGQRDSFAFGPTRQCAGHSNHEMHLQELLIALNRYQQCGDRREDSEPHSHLDSDSHDRVFCLTGELAHVIEESLFMEDAEVDSAN